MAHTISRPTSSKYKELLNNITWSITDHPNTAKAWKLDNEEDDSETEDIDLNQIVIDGKISLEVSDRYHDDVRIIYIGECTIYNILDAIHEFYSKLPCGDEDDIEDEWYVGDRIFFQGIYRIKDCEWFVSLGS